MDGRRIHDPGTDGPMSNVVTLDTARTLAARLESHERLRNGGSKSQARARLAGKMRVLPGTLYNLARNRLKRLDTELRDRLTAFAIRDLQHEIERLSHELEMARQMGAHPMSRRVGEIETHLAKARALMSEND
jgi:hypothetical protein